MKKSELRQIIKEEFSKLTEGRNRKITYPLVGSLNGDDPERLQEQFSDNYLAIQNAINTISKNMPHGRNYSDKESYKEAREEYQQIINSLFEAKEYMEDIVDYIDDKRER